MRPRPTILYHFTHVDHLGDIARRGLLSDADIQRSGLLRYEAGDHGIKERRRSMRVMRPPGGTVADYVPFYYAPRSPMMYVIKCGGVETYKEGCEPLVYLTTSVERLIELGIRPIFTDRNATIAYTRFTDDLTDLDDLVDWPLMRERMWTDTAEYPDRKERRMAECLVHHRVPWAAIDQVAAGNVPSARRATEILSTVGIATPVNVRPRWYF